MVESSKLNLDSSNKSLGIDDDKDANNKIENIDSTSYEQSNIPTTTPSSLIEAEKMVKIDDKNYDEEWHNLQLEEKARKQKIMAKKREKATATALKKPKKSSIKILLRLLI